MKMLGVAMRTVSISAASNTLDCQLDDISLPFLPPGEYGSIGKR